jgi:hypothetical protein
MSPSSSVDLTLLPGARELLGLHAGDLPQRDDLCGAFCASLALRSAGLQSTPDGEPLDQDAVALTAGSVVSQTPDPSILPFGEPGRRDYRLALPFVADSSTSGTTAEGLVGAIDELSGGRLVAIPYAGPWTVATLASLFELAAALSHPVTLLANLATRHLWGTHPGHERLLAYLLDGDLDGPPADWDVGHFVCVLARVRGPRGSAYVLADTYPSIGVLGVHAQPQEHLAAAIERREGPAGGVLAIVDAEDAPAVREGAQDAGLREGAWDNGTVAPGAVMPADGACASDGATGKKEEEVGISSSGEIAP